MNEEKVKSLLNKMEGPKLEHKGKEFIHSKQENIAKKISSFMNTDGGLILIGVKNNKPDGLIFKQKDEERLTSICRDRIDPPRPISLDVCQFNSKKIIIVEIVPSREPVKANGKFYKRVGSQTREMTYEEIKKKFAEAQKIYKIIKIEDANKIIDEKQIYRDKLLDKNQKKKQYLTLDSFSGPIISSSCNIYGKLYESFDETSKLIFTTLYNVTIEELTKILAQYYKIFGDFSYYTSAFSIVQSGFNWVGFGPRDFIQTIEKQKNRYNSIYKKYGKETHIHHREAAFFIDEIKDGLFFISCEPNFMKYSNKLTIDYFDVGFVLKYQPFSRLFNEFFNNIDIEPFTILPNYHIFPLNRKNDNLVITKKIEVSKIIPFQASGLIQSIRSGQAIKDDHTWISGAYGKVPDQLLKLGLNDNIIVNLREHHWLEDKVSYRIDRIKYTKFDLGCFPAAIVSIDIDWQYKN